MEKLKDALRDIKKVSYEKGLRVGKQAARDENEQKIRVAYERGLADAYRKFVAIAKNQCNPVESTADHLPGMALLPDKGFRKTPVELNLSIDDFLDSCYEPAEFGREVASDIYAIYRNYCNNRQIKVCPTITAFGKALSGKLFKLKSNGRNTYLGIVRKVQPCEPGVESTIHGDGAL